MMESPSLSAPKELRIEVPPSTLPQLDTQAELPAVEAAQLSPKIDRVRHHLIPARTTTCVRAPCLKRQVSVPVSSIANDLAGNRLEAALVHDRIASNPLPTSFTAPRNLILQAGSRHVHFDDAPPEEFFVLSGESYDRRPIKCTQGGSEFDMSLPPRSSSYNGDDVTDEDAPAPDDASAVMGLAEEPAPDVGFFGDPLLENWACIKNGTGTVSVGYQPRQQHSGLMASGRSLHFSALSSLQHASALNATTDAVPSNLGTQSQSQQPHPQVDSQKVSLPVHGFRSFGGLQNSLAPELTAVAAAAKPTASPKQVPPSPETTPPAVRHLSPDATPMPSPSLHKSMGAYSSVSYFDADSTFSQPAVPADSADSVCNEESLSSNDAVLASENILGAMEVLRDGQAPILSETSERFRIAQPFRVSEPAQTASGLSSPSSVKPASITIKVPDTSTQSTPRRVGLERRVAEKDAVRLSGLHPVVPIGGAAAASSPGWPSVLGITSSPLSSRCSSVDPWSSLSSDGDGDGTESPGNENSWISSNCTSPDLSPFEQIAEGLNHKAGPQFASSFGVTRPEASNPKHVDIAAAQPGPGFKPEQVSTGTDDSEHELTTPKTSDFADDAKFSSSVETVNTVSWEHKHMTTVSSASLFSCLSSADVSTTASEATTPDSSRRPSFQHADQASRHLSPRLRSGFGAREGSAIDTLDEDESHVLRVRSLSRDGHAKKKSPRCRFCRALRQRIRGSCTDSSAPASFGCRRRGPRRQPGFVLSVRSSATTGRRTHTSPRSHGCARRARA